MLEKPALTDTLLGDRYRLQRELGRGGMARVFAVRDEQTGRQLALKQLLVSGERGSAARVMFEREYHTLAQLTHPHIVRVFDYGVFGEDPYYTMELLDGADTREANRNGGLDVPQLCLLLRDCAAALGLIHSRRMVHRDVSTRNLWCTPEGRGKLIDFGALVAMGPQSRVAGTPPFIPPEALSGQPLDARSDLYALGAVGYYMLTQQNAYPARRLGDLSEYWRRTPRSPYALRPELPEALSDLVMALLSLDPRGRPAAASEVYERLSAIAELPAEDEPQLAQSFLSSPSLVGRSDALITIGHRLQRCVQGRGSHVSVLARSGLGRSRLLANGVLQAKLMGAVAVSVGATAVASARLSIGCAIAEQLAFALPMLPAEASELGPLLGHLSSSLHAAFGKPPLVELPATEYSAKLSAAIVSLVKIASRKQPVVLAVDDIHRADVDSLGVLGRIALHASEEKVLLLTSCDQAAVQGAPPALEQLVRARSPSSCRRSPPSRLTSCSSHCSARCQASTEGLNGSTRSRVAVRKAAWSTRSIWWTGGWLASSEVIGSCRCSSMNRACPRRSDRSSTAASPS